MSQVKPVASTKTNGLTIRSEASSPTIASQTVDEADTTSLSKFKIVFLGDQNVGKTSIITRFIYDTFDDTYQATIGIDFFSKVMSIDNKLYRLQLWDTAGLERFRSLIPSYIRNSNVAAIVYDITDRESFENVNKWVEDVRAERGNEVIMMLVGNKNDLNATRVVSFEQGEQKAKEFGMEFVETSAKTGFNIKSLFHKVVAQLGIQNTLPTNTPDVIDVNLDAKLSEKEPPRRWCSC
jgi:Ras-related protein Rab-6A